MTTDTPNASAQVEAHLASYLSTALTSEGGIYAIPVHEGQFSGEYTLPLVVVAVTAANEVNTDPTSQWWKLTATTSVMTSIFVDVANSDTDDALDEDAATKHSDRAGFVNGLLTDYTPMTVIEDAPAVIYGWIPVSVNETQNDKMFLCQITFEAHCTAYYPD